MRKFWSGVAKFLAVIFAIAFVCTAIGALLLTSIDHRLLSSATYKTALARQQVYARLPRILAEQLVTTMNYNPCTANPLACEGASPELLDCAKNKLGDQRYLALTTGGQPFTEDDRVKIQPCLDKYGTNLQPSSGAQQTAGTPSGGPPPFMKSLGVAEWETVISKLVPPAELRTTTEDLLDQVFAYLNGQQDTVTISMVSLKNFIRGQNGLDAILEIIRAQAPCTPQELADMQAALNSGQGNMILCRPTDDELGPMKGQIQAQLIQYASQIPNERVILSPATGENSANPGPLGSGPTGGIRIAHLVMRLSPDLPLLLLLFISLFVVRDPKSWLRWWGIPLFVTGLFSIGISVTASAAFEEVWLLILANRIPPNLSLGLVTLGQDLARAVFQSLFGGVTIGGIILGLLGLGMWIGSFFIKSRSEPEAPAVSPEPVP
jgi:hypothetical protein